MKYNQPFDSDDPTASYVDENSTGGVLGSVPPAGAIEDPQREITHVIDQVLGDGSFGSGQDPDDLTQLYQAIGAMIAEAVPVIPAADFPALGWQSTPPVSPTEGDRYVVKPTGSGAWAGQNHKIATWSGSAWTFETPVEGHLATYKDSTGRLAQIWFNGTVWASQSDTRNWSISGSTVDIPSGVPTTVTGFSSSTSALIDSTINTAAGAVTIGALDAGYWGLFGGGASSGGTGTGVEYLDIRVNGSTVVRSAVSAGSDLTLMDRSAGRGVRLNAGDVVTIAFYQENSGAAAIPMVSGITYLSGFRIGS